MLLVFFVIVLLLSPQVWGHEELLITLEINQHDCNVIATAYVSEDSVLISSEDLKKCKIHPPKEQATKEQDRINLLEHSEIKLNLDRQKLHLSLQIPPEWLETSTYDAKSEAPKTIKAEPLFGLGLNYDISAFKDCHQTHIQGIPDLFIFTPYGYGRSSWLVGSVQTSKTIRLETNWTWDNIERMERYRLGDSLSQAPDWGGSVFFTGLQFTTNFASQPHFISHVQPSINGSVTSPTSIDVLSNNQQLYHQSIKPGSYQINNIPVVTGAGMIQLEALDLLGNRQTLFIPYYSSPEILKVGLSDFSYEGGVTRQCVGYQNDRYGLPFLSLTHSLGITNSLTLGGHIEASKRLSVIGVDQSVLAGSFALLNFSQAVSHYRRKTSSLVSAGLTRQASPFSYGGKVIMTSGKFKDISLLTCPTHFHPKTITQFFINWHDGTIGSISGTLTTTRNHHRHNHHKRFGLVTIGYQRTLPYSLYFNISLGYQFKGCKQTSIYCSLSMPLGDSKYISSSYSQNKDYRQSMFTFQKSIPGELGTGYWAKIGKQTHDNIDYEAEVINLNEKGHIQLRTARYGQHYSHYGIIGGGVMIMDKSAFLTSKIQDSVAKVRATNFEKVKVYKNNLLVGHTNHAGEFIIPHINSFTESEIRIDDQDIPLYAQLSSDKATIFPSSPGAFLVDFLPSLVHPILIKVIDEEENPIEPGTIINWNNIQSSSIVGYGGEVYVSLDASIQSPLVGTIVRPNKKNCSIYLDMNKEDQHENKPILVCETHPSNSPSNSSK